LARKILLADDSVTAQNMGRKILADAGYEVIAVNNGSAALKKIIEIKPDVVVLDIYMPGYSGLEVCQRLKESPETARIPVLLTVGKLEPFKPEEAQRVGAEAFIVKPFEASELLSALSKLEDKVVPRPEPSRPGRFARTIAAMDDTSRGGREDAPSADNGWKNRIGFPHEKSEAERRAEEAEQQEQQKFVEESSRYNRRKSDQKEPTAKVEAGEQKSAGREAETVDVAALSGAGASSALPKDVSQEEVSALAAAAAQMQAAASAMEQNRALESSPVAPSASGQSPEAASEAVENKTAEEKTKSTAQAESEAQDAPVTMAAAAGSSDISGPRWTAVPVALEKDEAAVSLHEEMQKAFAKDSSVAPAQSTAESISSGSEFSVQAPIAAPAEGKTDSQFESQSAAMETPMDAAPAGRFEPVVASSQSSESAVADAEPMRPYSNFAGEASSTEIESTAAQVERFATQDESTPAPIVEAASAFEKTEVPAESSTLDRGTAIPSEKSDAPAETETVRSTAEAWASWSQNQNHVPHPEPQPAAATEQSESVPSEPAVPEINAAAVAAGAEKLLQAGPNGQKEGSPADVASIVDSVLAGLRPKLMEEISRKMSEKK
jgi:twitching motility two-component system response regulator PilH